MVYIKKLLLENFKSFGGKTEIKFMDKLNIIIGPNGSGKSNISEAISFVLGRMSKKGLRTDKLSHLIFNGGKRGKPAKYASVKIIFTNEDKRFPVEDDFVEIHRRINEDGQSEYRINGKKTTRLEVLNLLDYAGLSPDGFNMVMQGSIAKFVDMSSIERLKIIEEASGIATYEEKKQKALNELNKVEEKIKETRILLRERQKHLDELKKEKKQAEKYKNTKEQLRVTKGKLIFKQLDNRRKENKKIEDDIESLNEKIRVSEEKIAKYNVELKRIDDEVSLINETLGKQGADKKKELENKINNLKDELNRLEADIKSHNNEIERIKDRILQINNNITSYKEEAKKIEADLKKYEEQKKEVLDRLKSIKGDGKEGDEINFFELKARVNEIKEMLIDKKERLRKLLEQQESFNNFKDLQEELERKNELMETIISKLKQEMENNSMLALKIEQSRNKIDELRRKIDRLNTQKNMTFRYGGTGLKELMKQNLHGVIGTVSQLFSVKDKRYELPLKIGGGKRLLNVVTTNEDVANLCINFLRKNRLGVVTFLPLNKIKGYSVPLTKPNIEGVIDFAINLIDFDLKYKQIFEYIFKDTLIVSDFETAKRVGIGSYRMITLEGDLIEKSGAITGGYRIEKEKGILLDKNIDKELEELQNEKAKMEDILSRLMERKRENDNIIMGLREKRVATETEIKNINMLIDNLREKSKKFDIKELGRLNKEIAELEEELIEKENKTQELESKFNINKLEETKKKIRELEERLNTINVNVGIKRSRLEQIKEKDLVELEKVKKELEDQVKLFEKEKKEMENKVGSLKAQLETYEKEEKGFEDKLRENYEKREKLEERRREIKIKIEEIKIHINNYREKINNLKLLNAEIKSKIEGLELKFEEYKDLEIKEVRKSVRELEHEIFLLEKKLETFGNVNLKALDVFKMVEEEFEEINNKVKQLEEEKEAIIKTMEEIESKKIATFMETFKEIEANFERIFSILSPGGIANLIIENPQNPLEGGIDVKARPKGKKFLSLKSMSGGEKTITALSFIFALQEYEPAPFYIMDEVEAALDKENATRFGRLCKQYSEKAQFIIISHNDNVISEADYLYGISMNPDGISKVITLKLPE